MSIISARDVNVILNAHHILEGITFDIEPGEIAAIIGPNGSGKTTLLKTLLGLVPYEGEITIAGSSPARLHTVASKIGYVPQRLEFDRTMPITVHELFAIHLRKGARIPTQTLKVVGVDRLLERKLGVLSGGEFQRVLLALALLNDPEILFLDEPAASVDIEGAAEIYQLITTLRKERLLTILIVSHDVDVVFRYADKVLCVNHRLLCKGAPQDALTAKVMEELYGKLQTPYHHKEQRHGHDHAHDA